MTIIPDKEPRKKQKEPRSGVTGWLLQPKTKTGLRSPHIWIIIGLFVVFTYIYYGILTAYHDVYVVIFFYPLIYAAFVYRLRGVIVSGLVFLGVLFPYTFILHYDVISL